MMELSDKVKCDASSFEVEWRASEPGWLPPVLDTPDDEKVRRGLLLLRLVKEASGSRKRGARGQQICVSSASAGQDKAAYFGASAAEASWSMLIQPSRAGHFSWGGPVVEAQDDGHLA